MKTNHSVLHLASTLIVCAVTSILSIPSSQAGSRIGFRDESVAVNRITPNDAAKSIQSVRTPGNAAPGLNRHGADDPANHDRGDDHGRHGAGHR